MKIKIKATNLELTPALTDYINKKFLSFSHLLKRIENKTEPIFYLEIARNTKHHHSGKIFTADVNLSLPKKNLYANHSDIDIRTAIDILEEKLKKELIKHKERLIEKRNKNV